MARGAAWMLLMRILDRSLGVVSTIILARLLIPGDFGLVAMATAIWALLQLMGAFSFDVALIRDPSASREHFDTVWTITVLFGIVTALLICLLAMPASRFYWDPRLEAVMYALALAALVGSFANVGVVRFRKDLAFRREFQYLFGRRLLGVITTVTLAFFLRNYWAMVCGIGVGEAAGIALSYRVDSYRPRFSLTRAAELFRFSRWLFLNNLLLFLNARSTDFILGRVFGAPSLGIYNMGNEIATLPTSELVAPINRAVFPGYAKVASDVNALRTEFLRVFSMIALISLPAAAGLAATSSMIVHVVLGQKWMEALPVIRALAYSGMLTALVTNNGMVYLALGRPKIPAVLLACFLPFMIPAIVVGAHRLGTVGAALAVLTTNLVMSPVNFVIVSRLLQIPVSEYLRRAWRPVVAAAAMFWAVSALVSQWLPHAWGSRGVGLLLCAVVFGGLVYSGAVTILWTIAGRPGGPERFLFDRASVVLIPRSRL